MGTSIVKVIRSKETNLGIKVHHSKRKTDFLKEIVKRFTLRRLLFKEVKTYGLFRNKLEVKNFDKSVSYHFHKKKVIKFL